MRTSDSNIAPGRPAGRLRALRGAAASAILAVALLPGVPTAVSASIAVDVGYRDDTYTSLAHGRATAEKPESKLWWTDGRWWGCLWDEATAAHRIQEFNTSTQSWSAVGPIVESRTGTQVDCLWDGTTLYIVSHELLGNSDSYLNSYDYDALTKTYTLRPGFPVAVTDRACEALTIAKDTTGKLWVAWERSQEIWVNCSQGSDTDWGTPFVVPGMGNQVADDDICVVTSFADRIGVFWSNQADQADYFLWRQDGDPDQTWSARETALFDPGLGNVADDHMNVAVESDGTLYVVCKTSLSVLDDPILFLLRRELNGTWTRFEAGRRRDDFTRPIVLIDEESRRLHIFTNCIASGKGTINWKSTDLDNIDFTTGLGDLFIKSHDDQSINDPTSTKQNIDSVTGILVQAADGTTESYLHNFYRPLSAPLEDGYRDWNYGVTTVSSPTAEKPESKLWWNDGSWWGCFWDDNVGAHRIHRFLPAEQGWLSVGPDADPRPETLVDCLFDGERLYVSSHPVSGGDPAELRSYSYDGTTGTYALRDGFPVDVSDAEGCEALTITKDTTGKLWASWESGRNIRVACTTTSDLDWAPSFVMPSQPGKVDSDDISVIVAFGGKVGVLWSDQSEDSDYFAYHVDGDPDDTWSPLEIAAYDPVLGAVANDHLNVTVGTDGTIYAVTKTNLSGSTDPAIAVLRRDVAGAWTSHLVNTRSEGGTRPIALVDEGNRQLHVLYNSDETGDDAIHIKSASLDDLLFPTGIGDLFLADGDYDAINNPTSTKQTVTSTTGLLVMASDADTRFYVHRAMSIAAPASLPEVDTDAGTLDFGTSDLGVPAAGAVTVYNVGAADLHVTRCTIGGGNADEFSISPGIGAFVLAAGDSAVVDVVFTPAVPGARTALFRVHSDDPGAPVLAVTLDGTGFSSATGVTPSAGPAVSLRLGRPRPNPTRGALGSSFQLSLPQADRATLSLYDVAGRLVARRAPEALSSGTHVLRWSPGPISAGTYFVRLTTDAGESASTKWVLIR